MVRRLNILVGLNYAVAFDRRAFVGIAALANELGDVDLHLFERLGVVTWAEAVRSLGIDGVIVSRLYQLAHDELSALGIPYVSLADAEPLGAHQHVVAMDEQAIGALVARHYLEAGYQHFAVCTVSGLYESFRGRIDGFADEVRASGRPCELGPAAPLAPGAPDVPDDERRWIADAGAWLAARPKPLAVFAPYDYHARNVVKVARQAGLRVPEDVAVIGVDDDDVHCMTTVPQLSSVVTPGRHVGQAALTTVLRAVRGEPGVPRRTLIPPPSVMVRGSSSPSALHDEDVIAAVRFIQENVARGVTVDAVAAHVTVSRRTLERRFMTALSHTVQDEIRRAKVGRARRLLIDTDLGLAQVARKSGFGRQQQLCRVIKLATGQTPAQLRQSAREIRPI